MLGDFGLSKQLQDTFDMAKSAIGTPFYMVSRHNHMGIV
jgi:hypothetical protein